MTERPILFSGPMVRAIIEGRKTQTRRVANSRSASCPYAKVVGDRLWVRETFHQSDQHGLLYAADDTAISYELKCRPSIHMPRSACRLVLDVTNVRVERLHEISQEDAEAEGVKCDMSARTFRDHYRALWDLLNAKRGYGWDTNPMVWVVAFKRHGDIPERKIP